MAYEIVEKDYGPALNNIGAEAAADKGESSGKFSLQQSGETQMVEAEIKALQEHILSLERERTEQMEGLEQEQNDNLKALYSEAGKQKQAMWRQHHAQVRSHKVDLQQDNQQRLQSYRKTLRSQLRTLKKTLNAQLEVDMDKFASVNKDRTELEVEKIFSEFEQQKRDADKGLQELDMMYQQTLEGLQKKTFPIRSISQNAIDPNKNGGQTNSSYGGILYKRQHYLCYESP